MSEVINLADRRAPVWYTIRIGHHWDDRLEAIIEDVSDSDQSQRSVNDAIARLAETRMNEAHIYRAMLSRIDALMGCSADTPECDELERLVAACQAYETALISNPEPQG